MNRPYQGLLVAVVSEGLASHANAGRQCGLADKSVSPNLVEKLLFGHHPIAVGQKMRQHIEDLGLYAYRITVTAQYQSVGLQLVPTERIDHVSPPQARPTGAQAIQHYLARSPREPTDGPVEQFVGDLRTATQTLANAVRALLERPT